MAPPLPEFSRPVRARYLARFGGVLAALVVLLSGWGIPTAAAAAVAPSGSMPLPPLPPAAPAAAPERTAPLTNADIIALRQAGFGDDLILAKVAASPAAYTLTPAEMVALKKAGVSERVITAMVAAK